MLEIAIRCWSGRHGGLASADAHSLRVRRPPATAEINNGQITHIPGELGVWVFILGDMGVFTETCQK